MIIGYENRNNKIYINLLIKVLRLFILDVCSCSVGIG